MFDLSITPAPVGNELQAAFTPPPRKRGRKKGSKNKPKHKTSLEVIDEAIESLRYDLEALKKARKILAKK